jgi:copper chaperone CopZ
MSCAACVRHVTDALDGLSGVVHAGVDLQKGEAVVEHLPGYVDVRALVAVIRGAGHAVRVERSVSDGEASTPTRDSDSIHSCSCCAARPNAAQWAIAPRLSIEV